MKPKSSEDMPGPEPGRDTERETRDAIVRDADKTDRLRSRPRARRGRID
jgi:hypothetical protein